jgi:hypothetical protein
MEALQRLAQADGFIATEASTWGLPHAAAFVGAVTVTFELLSHAVPALFAPMPGRIEARGKHHDTLDARDYTFLAINRAASVPFTYHFLKAAWLLPCVKWCACAAPAFSAMRQRMRLLAAARAAGALRAAASTARGVVGLCARAGARGVARGRTQRPGAPCCAGVSPPRPRACG